MDWTAAGVVLTAAALVWGVVWAVCSRRTAARQAARTADAIHQAERKREGRRVIRSGAVGVIQMCESLLERYEEAPGEVPVNVVAIKIPGRLRQLQEAWIEFGGSADKRVRAAYESLAPDVTIRWFDAIPGGSANVPREDIFARVRQVRDAAAAVREAIGKE
jgi:hypothetical protein